MDFSPAVLVAEVATGLLAIYVLWELFASPLRHIPGPFLAKFTDLWRLLNVLGRHAEITLLELHERHGKAVRIGPDMVSVSDPEMVNQIYSRREILTKGDFYKVFDLNVHGTRVPVPFSTRDEQMNTAALKPVVPMFSMGQLIKLEPLIDKTIQCFLDELDVRFEKPGKYCDIDRWLEFCAWDVIAELTWGKRLGFLEEGKDLLRVAAVNRSAHEYISAVGQMPWLDHLLERNPIQRIGPPSYGAIIQFMLAQIASRTSNKDGRKDRTETRDMLDNFIQAAIADDKLMGYLFANVAAGSDTVATELRSAVYHLCKNPVYLKRLRQELDNAQLSVPVSWAHVQELPYLNAVISEACRIMPGVVLPLERKVGLNGMALPDGKTILPPGTTVGINPYVVHRDKSVYGEDADLFQPDRWLRGPKEAGRAFQDRLHRMKSTDMTFGAGKRVCFGRNLALIEMPKIIASLVCTFDFELVDSDKKWQTHSAWLMYQSDMDVRLKRRVERVPA